MCFVVIVTLNQFIRNINICIRITHALFSFAIFVNILVVIF